MAEENSEKLTIESVFGKTKVGDIMRTPAPTVNEEDDLSTAAKVFAEQKASHLLVIDEGKRLRGILSPKYLYKTHSPQKIISDQITKVETDNSELILDGESYFRKDSLDTYFLSKIMFKNPFTLKPDDLIATALISMSSRHLSCIPVVNDFNEVAGVLTHQEIVDFMTTVVERYFQEKSQ